jgi:tetratricopeptide (TPR) repeat protein
MKQPDKGLQAVQDVLQRTPDWPAGQEVLGSLALQAGRVTVAETAFQTTLQLNPKSANASIALGDISALRQQPDTARTYYQKAVSLDPQSAVYHVRLGQLAESESDWNEAITEYKKAIDLDPSSGVAKNNLAWVYAEHGGNLSVALGLAQAARQVMPDNPSAADTLGWIYVKEGFPPTALQYLTECVSKRPDNPTYHYHLGVAYFRMGQKEKAKLELGAALRLKADFSEAGDARNLLSQITSN